MRYQKKNLILFLRNVTINKTILFNQKLVKLLIAIQRKIKERINPSVDTKAKGNFLHKQRIRFRKKWNYDTSTSSSCMRCDYLYPI